MDTDTELQGILASYRKKQDEEKKVADVKKNDEDDFIKNFIKLRDDVIGPALKKIEKQLTQDGHFAEIETTDERYDSFKKTETPSQIKLVVVPAGFPTDGRSWEKPGITFISKRYSKSVWVHENNIHSSKGGGSSGSRKDNLKLEDITEELVLSETLSFLKNLFRV